MREIRRKQIKNRVFRKSDLQILSAAIVDEFQKTKKSVDNSNDRFSGTISFFVSCDDDTSYHSETPDFWNEGGICDIKRIKSITMRSQCYTPMQSIEVSITRGRSGTWDMITVDGSERDWVNGVFNHLTEILSAAPPQNKTIRKITNFMLLPVSIGYAVLIWFFLALIITCAIPLIIPEKLSFYQIPTFYSEFVSVGWKLFIGFIGLSIVPALLTKDWVLALWPEIEFDFGPDHMNLQKQRRNRIVSLFAIVVIPTLLTIAYDVMKTIITGH